MRVTLLRVSFLLMLVLLPEASHADEFQPLAVRINLTAGNVESGFLYQVETRTPNDRRLKQSPRAILDSSCQRVSDTLSKLGNRGYKRQEAYKCPKSLHGTEVSIMYPNANPGLSTLLAIDHGQGESATTALAAHQSGWTIPATLSSAQHGWQYFKLGFEHLLGGFDHLLFISCLLFICLGNTRKLIWTVTAFTVAHSISLGLSAFGKIVVNVAAIETIIALSIAYLASDIARHIIGNTSSALAPESPSHSALAPEESLSYRYPASIAAIFGLFHGLGFANILNEYGLPNSDMLVALFSFNLGIEVGQLIFVSAILTTIWLISLLYKGFKQSMTQGTSALLCSYVIGAVALFWTIERFTNALGIS
ncbi:MAG: hydrogenase/urease accessory protein HupE [Cryomorphaceae bacterium]|jgi:hydrogenase/urease accessory protein HupE